MRTIKLIGKITGKEEDLSLEHRLFLSTIIVGIIVSLLATLVSLLISSHFTVIIITLSSSLLLGIVYYFVKRKGNYKPFVAPIIVLSFTGVSLVWIVDGGINGSNLLVAFVILVLGLIIVPNKNKKYVISLFITLVIVIYLIQRYRPDLITNFSSETARWTDSIITAIYSSIFLFFIIRFVHGSYIEERKRAEDNELKFKTLSENSQDSIARYDRQYRHTYINKAGLEQRGLNLDQLIGKTYRETGILDEEQARYYEEDIESVFVTKQPKNGHYSLEGPKGRTFYDCRLFPEFNSENEVDSVLAVARNITDIKQSEFELKELNTDKDRFISILGHDLKNPLYTLQGISELFAENIQNYKTAEIEAVLKEINKTTRITIDLLEDILKWTKAQSGKIPFKPQKLAFTDIYENIIEILGPNALTKNIKINLLASDSLCLVADRDMLLTIMRNLLSNAIKFTKSGGEIKISAEEGPDYVSISISDNGIGIAPKDLNKLFKISEVHTTKGTAEEKGTGLGLLLCKEFVEKHGGEISVESEEGKGSTFVFTLSKTIVENLDN
jgi:PAS domain S-box-containing protein